MGKEPMFTKMIICEAISYDKVHLIATCMRHHVRSIQAAGHSIMIERDGKMVVLTLDWHTMDGLLRHRYRDFIMGCNHLLTGDFVVKIFEKAQEAEL
jgi:hypothetical protein